MTKTSEAFAEALLIVLTFFVTQSLLVQHYGYTFDKAGWVGFYGVVMLFTGTIMGHATQSGW